MMLWRQTAYVTSGGNRLNASRSIEINSIERRIVDSFEAILRCWNNKKKMFMASARKFDFFEMFIESRDIFWESLNAIGTILSIAIGSDMGCQRK